MSATLLDWVDGAKEAIRMILVSVVCAILCLILFVFITAVLWVLGAVGLYVLELWCSFGVPPKLVGIHQVMFDWWFLKIFFGIMAGLWLIYTLVAIIDEVRYPNKGGGVRGLGDSYYDDPPYPLTPCDSYDYPYGS